MVLVIDEVICPKLKVASVLGNEFDAIFEELDNPVIITPIPARPLSYTFPDNPLPDQDDNDKGVVR